MVVRYVSNTISYQRMLGIMFPLSILELGRIRQGSDRRVALDEARSVAQHAETLGYLRIWVAEHHNLPGVSTAATAVVLAHIAGGTSTLETLFPGRIDLGLGRAPGTDQATLRALRRDPMSAEHFPQDVLELQAFLGPVQSGQRIEAIPGSGTNVPLWILGSSLFGAQLAAALGLPFGFASHFAPQALHRALELYRAGFKPSAQLDKPYATVGVNVIAAETDAEARRLATSQQMSFTNIIRGTRGLMQPPIDDIETDWTPQEKAHAGQMLSCSVVGSRETVRTGLRKLIAETGADELMMVSDCFYPEKRLRSLELTAEAMV